MNFIFIIESDAYLKGALNIAKSFNLNINLKIFATKKILVENNVDYFDLENSEICQKVFDSDFLFLGMGGKNLNKLIKKSREINSKSKIISYFPGIVHFNILESFATRLLCDAVLLNSKSDYYIYRLMAERFLGFNNGILFGAPWVLLKKKIDYQKKIDLLFIEQSIIPDKLSLRKKMLNALIELAEKYKDKKIVIALRAKKGNESSHKVLYPLDEFRFHEMPKNIIFSYSDIYELIRISERVATVSSSAAYIAISQGKSTYFLRDFGVHRKYGNDLFKKSGMLCRINELFIVSPKINGWKSLNVQGINEDAYKDFYKILKNELSFIPGFKIYNLFNIFFILKLNFLKNQKIFATYKLYKSIININSRIHKSK